MPRSLNRPQITMACEECGERNYQTTKHRINQRGRLELRKFCPRCRHHTLHKETK